LGVFRGAEDDREVAPCRAQVLRPKPVVEGRERPPAPVHEAAREIARGREGGGKPEPRGRRSDRARDGVARRHLLLHERYPKRGGRTPRRRHGRVERGRAPKIERGRRTPRREARTGRSPGRASRKESKNRRFVIGIYE